MQITKKDCNNTAKIKIIDTSNNAKFKRLTNSSKLSS